MTNNIQQYNLRKMINNHFFDRDQTKEILENFVTVNNNGILHVGLPEPANISLTTPNNAITTADVGTLKAKVTDSSNVNCYGVPVEFVNKKTRQVLGYGLTDLNGEVTHNFRLEDADIFDVQARLSQDYIFNDFGVLNNTNSWSDMGNLVREVYPEFTKIYRDDNTSVSFLYSPVLGQFVDIDFSVRLNDGLISDSFCGLFETNSSGSVTGALNGFNLGQLGLTSESVGEWVRFHIGVLDDSIILVCRDTGALLKLDVTVPSYFVFCFCLTGDLTSLDFKDVKINKCSTDLTMFVKDKSNLLTFNQWSCGDHLHNLTDFTYNTSMRNTVTTEYNFNGDYSIKLTPTVNEYAILRIPFDFDSTRTYLLKVKCKNNISNAKIEIRKSSGQSTSSLTIPVLDGWYEYILEFTPNQDESLIVFLTFDSENALYLDDISLTIP